MHVELAEALVSHELTPLMRFSIASAYIGGITFLTVGIVLSFRRGRLHPLFLLCIAAISISWIEAPYDYVMYAQFPPAIPRMPSWWPLNKTYGGLPSSVPLGYIQYFVLPAVIGAALGRKLSKKYGWRRPVTLLNVGFLVGFGWALFFNAVIGAQLGIFYYGKVIPGLAIFEGTKHQYPIYDAVAMGILMMVFTYLLGRTDSEGRNVVESWSDGRTSNRVGSAALSIGAMVLIANVVYGAVFAPHLVTKLGGWVTAGPSEQLFPGVPNQPE